MSKPPRARSRKAVGTEEVRAGRDLYAGGRATFGISDRANVFVKAGYTIRPLQI